MLNCESLSQSDLLSRAVNLRLRQRETQGRSQTRDAEALVGQTRGGWFLRLALLQEWQPWEGWELVAQNPAGHRPDTRDSWAAGVPSCASTLPRTVPDPHPAAPLSTSAETALLSVFLSPEPPGSF